MKRLTTDEPVGNFEGLMNFCYGKNKEAYLRYAGGEDDIELAEYTARCCKERGCTIDAQEIKADIMDCDCPFAAMYNLGVQAVEMRGRLKHYEDLIEQGQLVELPCKVGDTVWVLVDEIINKGEIDYWFTGANELIASVIFETGQRIRVRERRFGKTTFLTESEAMAKLEEMKK